MKALHVIALIALYGLDIWSTYQINEKEPAVMVPLAILGAGYMVAFAVVISSSEPK
jgi:hypothetical protein